MKEKGYLTYTQLIKAKLNKNENRNLKSAFNKSGKS